MRFSLGASDCDVELLDPYVSKLHCLLERRGPSRLIVRDNQSKNGVAIDGTNVEVGELRPGSILRVGCTELVALSERSIAQSTTADELVGEHPRFLEAVNLATRAGSAGDCSVLVLGETGTGKELFARIIHEESGRADGPFVALNCGALAPGLLGSELFGHVRGAFTGAVADRSGVFVEATNGSLFLDEIGELPMGQQPHLLRVLETQRVRPVGSTGERTVDVRFVAATNRINPVKSKCLRTDLYHRIATVVIELPPLRERASDIPLLIHEFIFRKGGMPRAIAPETMEALLAYPWPGNVRELKQAVERALVLCDQELTLDALLPSEKPRLRTAPPTPRKPRRPPTYDARQRDMLLDAYAIHGSVRKAARALGIPRSTFADRLRRYRLSAG